ncbi:winged helix DNA-binding domain-containing protein [Microbacterium sp. KUDC0406]|uniref:winged helix DNA-binding domain-containing protein n=1 Tax=Microbacterium sp. KUDC0406 TaxID=2909588 RepID=UPI001F43B8B2|nr:winged helix DNA-binding domain-containing protein [Microbacterium sp. KUDC0406]UJP08754.1 winged helix DNA-binding domain-containing protein [Microbacterium sp. KUDC0406]
MNTKRLLAERLRSHRLTAPARTVADAASHLLAVQSQDFVAGRWALAARTRGAVTLSQVDAAFTRGEIVRAWPMRGTLHTVPARDLGWMLSVTAERQRQQAASRHRQLGIDDGIVAAAERVIRERIDGGMTRAQVFEAFESAGIDPREQRGIHLLFVLTINGALCQGPVAGKDQLFVLAEEWITDAAQPDDPLAELFVRYIDGHGPAGAADLAWWAGLTLGMAREAVERGRRRVVEIDDGVFTASDAPRRAPRAASVHALPAFDEYYISYADRSPVCAPEHAMTVGPGKNGMVRPTIVADGRIVGTWSHAGAGGPAPEPQFFAPPSDEVADGAASALARFAAFRAG